MNTNAHLFALYVPKLSPFLPTKETAILSDQELNHRIVRVLRLGIEESVILFDASEHAIVKILEVPRMHQITVQIIQRAANTILQPEITIALPLLKKEALETALYAMTCAGVTTIILYSSKKTHTSTFNAQLFNRLERIMIAAAEQSKQFAIPKLQGPVSFEQLIAQPTAKPFLFADPEGTPSAEVIKKLQTESPKNITIMVGPEGDLVEAEKEKLRPLAEFWRLTPTVLKAEEAIFLATGMVRALVGSS